MRVKGTYFTYDDGSPFFWLADTAWNAPLRGSPEEWEEYLDARARQGFTAIQFVATQWRGCSQPRYGRLYEEQDGRLIINEAAFAQMDRWVEMIGERGLVAVPVMLWANTPACPGQALSEASCIQLGRHMLERWQGHQTIWFLAGDGNYTADEVAARWKRIGRGIFADHPEAVATMHPCGLSWVGEIFAEEPWYSFVGIQSGHGNKEANLRWLLEGPYSSAWRTIRKPFVNLEPNYEFAIPYGTQDRFTAYHVRRASYWSLLSAPIAGISYGNNAIWVWGQRHGEHAEGHGTHWVTRPWREGLETEGIRSLQVLKEFVLKLPWRELLPARELLAAQPGIEDPRAFITVAATPGRECIVAYLPGNAEIRLRGELLPPGLGSYWVDPRNGAWTSQGSLAGDDEVILVPPSDEDWLLVLKTTAN